MRTASGMVVSTSLAGQGERAATWLGRIGGACAAASKAKRALACGVAREGRGTVIRIATRGPGAACVARRILALVVAHAAADGEAGSITTPIVAGAATRMVACGATHPETYISARVVEAYASIGASSFAAQT